MHHHVSSHAQKMLHAPPKKPRSYDFPAALTVEHKSVSVAYNHGKVKPCSAALTSLLMISIKARQERSVDFLNLPMRPLCLITPFSSVGPGLRDGSPGVHNDPSAFTGFLHYNRHVGTEPALGDRLSLASSRPALMKNLIPSVTSKQSSASNPGSSFLQQNHRGCQQAWLNIIFLRVIPYVFGQMARTF